MTSSETSRNESSIVLPAPRLATSKYIRNVIHGGVLYVSGQLPYDHEDIRITGVVGNEVSIGAAQDAARLCALNALAIISHELDGLHRVHQVLRMTGYVASTADFAAHSAVVDVASAVLLEVLGERGRHARSAIGVSSLPRNAPVEIELTVAVHPAASVSEHTASPSFVETLR
jgi:enamine deaminase RidA (YjgF/YER057c/UK114 family)